MGMFLAWAVACSEDSRYRVLSVFFDGVPEPGADRGAPADRRPGDVTEIEDPGAPRRRVIYKHPPYVDKRCKDCHTGGGYLIKSPEEGLCQVCHPDIPGEVAFLHGPLAVNACLACHASHQSDFPWLLLDDLHDICYRCHEFADLSTGLHHDSTDTVTCVECHDPHGGGDKYFLRPSEI
jgi:predicted CXXCH cytochrome family protein